MLNFIDMTTATIRNKLKSIIEHVDNKTLHELDAIIELQKIDGWNDLTDEQQEQLNKSILQADKLIGDENSKVLSKLKSKWNAQ